MNEHRVIFKDLHNRHNIFTEDVAKLKEEIQQFEVIYDLIKILLHGILESLLFEIHLGEKVSGSLIALISRYIIIKIFVFKMQGVCIRKICITFFIK